MDIAWTILLVSVIAVGAVVWQKITSVPPLPKLERSWWGPGEPNDEDESIRPFKVHFSDEKLKYLQERLKHHNALTPPLEGTGFEYGFNTNYLKRVVDFWSSDYDWRDREAFLNSFPQFKTRVSGLDLHFIHVKPVNVPKNTRIIPILLLHGWPSSTRDFYKVIPLLVASRKEFDFVFEVIVPSLPGYGFSTGSAKPGLGLGEMAVVLHNLMERIGHSNYYVHGGDWGSVIGTNIAILYPNNVTGLHINMCYVQSALSGIKTLLGSFFPSFVVDKEHAHLMYPFKEKFLRTIEETGYMHLQATKPDTVGVALSDSPVGLTAYLLEKYSTATKAEWRFLADGGLENKYTLTDLLDNVMIYWLTGSITTSIRLYSETFNKRQMAMGLTRIPVTVPTACAVFPDDLTYQSEFIVKEKYPNLVRFTNMPRGGHFAAFEEPELIAEDLWTTIGIVEERRGIVIS